MTTKHRFLPYSKLFKSKSLSTIPENKSLDFRMLWGNANQSETVAQPPQPPIQTIDIFNSLRIPDAIKDLPKFEGNPRLLYEFISNVEEILLHIRGADNTPQGLILLRAIRNKIDGPANEVLNMYGTSLNWDEIRGNLISHYSDKRTETSLIRDLHSLKQFNKPIEKFYSEIMEIQSALSNNLSIHESEDNVIRAKRDLFAEMCLNAFLSGLREPMGSTIRAMRPESLPTALDYCIREQNIHYIRSNLNSPKYPQWRQSNQYTPYRRYSHNYSNTIPRQGNYYQPQRNLNYSVRPYYTNNNNNSEPNLSNNNRNFSFRNNQTPHRNLHDYKTNQHSDNFSQQANWGQSQPPPEPMETNSGFSRIERGTNKFKTSPSTRFSRITGRNEMNNINEFRSPRNEDQAPYFNHTNKTNLDQYVNYNIDDNQDFWQSALNNKQDT